MTAPVAGSTTPPALSWDLAGRLSISSSGLRPEQSRELVGLLDPFPAGPAASPADVLLAAMPPVPEATWWSCTDRPRTAAPRGGTGTGACWPAAAGTG